MRQDNDDLHLPIHQDTKELMIAMKHEIDQMMGLNATIEANAIIIHPKHADVLGMGMMGVRKKKKKRHKSNGWDKF